MQKSGQKCETLGKLSRVYIIRPSAIKLALRCQRKHPAVEMLPTPNDAQAIAQNLHHLVSTKSTSGVFNSPYMRDSGRIPTIRGVEVEKHLTISAKDLLRYVPRPLSASCSV